MTAAAQAKNGELRSSLPTQELTLFSSTKLTLDGVNILDIGDDPMAPEPFSVLTSYSPAKLSKRQACAIVFAVLEAMYGELISKAPHDQGNIPAEQAKAIDIVKQQVRDYARYGTIIPW